MRTILYHFFILFEGQEINSLLIFLKMIWCIQNVVIVTFCTPAACFRSILHYIPQNQKSRNRKEIGFNVRYEQFLAFFSSVVLRIVADVLQDSGYDVTITIYSLPDFYHHKMKKVLYLLLQSFMDFPVLMLCNVNILSHPLKLFFLNLFSL